MKSPSFHRLRPYRFAVAPLGLGLLWIVWEARGGARLLDLRLHNTILIGLAAWVVIAWPRDRRRLDDLAHEVEVLRKSVDKTAVEATAPAARYARETLYAVKLVQGQLDQYNGRLDALVQRVDELHADAYADGLAARQLRDPKGDATDILKSQVNGLWLSKGN